MGRKKKVIVPEEVIKKKTKDKINDINENDPHIYDPTDPYGDKLRR